MKQLTEIFQALLGIAALICTSLIALGRLAWRTLRNNWMNRSWWFRRIVAVILIAIPVGIAALSAFVFHEENYGRRYWENEALSKNVRVHGFNDGKYRVFNQTNGEYTTGKLKWVSKTSTGDSLTVYAVPGKRGFLNVNTGEVVIDAEKNDYTKAWVFSEGLAAVMKDDKIGFINTKNEVVIPFQFDYSDKCQKWNFGYLFHNGYCMMTNEEGKQGLIDVNGKWVVEPTYDEVWSPNEIGYRLVVEDGEYGLLDSLCNVIYPAAYYYIDVLDDGFVLTKDGRMWKENTAGEVVNPFLFDATYYLNYPKGYDEDGNIEYEFSEYAKYEVCQFVGIMNRITGKPITPAIYWDINMLSKDLFEVHDPETGNWYLLGSDGKPAL